MGNTPDNQSVETEEDGGPAPPTVDATNLEQLSVEVLADRANSEWERAEEAKERAARHASEALHHALLTGEYLCQAKNKLEHGEWMGWVEENFQGSGRTARRYMKLAKGRDQLLENWPSETNLAIREAERLLRDDSTDSEDDSSSESDPADAPSSDDDPDDSSPREHDDHTRSLLEESSTPAEPTAEGDTSAEPSPKPDTDADGRDGETSAREALHSSETDEWHTPAEYIEAARDVLGRIDLDPASSPAANERIGADDIYTREDNGLEQEWEGRVWLNPPYGRHPETGESNQAVWSQRLIKAYEGTSELVTAAILLVNAVPDRGWFQRLWQYPICFCDSRIRFLDPSGEPQDSPTHGNAFVYLGGAPERFCAEFAEFGTIVTSVITDDDGTPTHIPHLT